MINGSPIGDHELRQLFDEDDRARQQRAEHADLMARRRAPVRETHPADALYAVPAAEDQGFSDRQADAVAEVVHQLRKEFAADIERLEQKILQMTVRLVQPGEIAEQKVYSLNDRLAIMERHVERALAEPKTDAAAMATQYAVEVAELRAENRELKGLFTDLLRQFEATTKTISDIKERATSEVEGVRRDANALVSSFQVEVAELRGRISGLLRDYVP
jgi:hypothetical protein